MKEFRLSKLSGHWHLQASRYIHTARFIQLDHALNYLRCRIRSGEVASVVITDAEGVTERRTIEREGVRVADTVWR